jgi:hypothetical protein
MPHQEPSTMPATLAERFVRFHMRSPEVYSTLVELARRWVQATGRNRLGIATLYERARWELALATSDADFKLNNDYRAFYARLIMLQEPDLADLFELRSSEANDWLLNEPRCALCSHVWSLTHVHVTLGPAAEWYCTHAQCHCVVPVANSWPFGGLS